MFATATTSCIETFDPLRDSARERGHRRESGFGSRGARTRWARCNGSARGRGSPVTYMFPDAAITPRSETLHSARWSFAAEWRDTHHPPRAGARAGIEAMGSRPADFVDHHIGVDEQGIERRIVAREREHLLAPRSMPARCSRRADRRPAALPHDLRPEVAENAPGAGAGIVAEVQDTQSFEHRLCHAEPSRNLTEASV